MFRGTPEFRKLKIRVPQENSITMENYNLNIIVITDFTYKIFIWSILEVFSNYKW
jgi:hypothetical protein